MKICQLCAVDFTLHHFLTPLMEALAARGHEVVGVCSEGPLLDKVRARGIRVAPVTIRRSLNPASLLRSTIDLVQLFRRERFDIVHVHTPVAALAGRLAARIAGVKTIVYTAHGFYFHERMPAWKYRLFVAMEWLGGRATDLLLTQAEEDAEAARRHNLCRTGRVAAIGNGSDPQKFTPGPSNIRAELGIPEDRVIIVAVGRLVREKGYAELFEAMRAVDALLLVVGDRLASDHAGAVSTEGLDPERVRLLGYRGDVPDILRTADIFTLPSWREGMPRSIIEAMLTGVAVVATDIRGSREEVVEGETGLLVPVEDAVALAAALSKLAGDRDLRRRMGAAGLARARELYDEAKVIERQIVLLGA